MHCSGLLPDSLWIKEFMANTTRRDKAILPITEKRIKITSEQKLQHYLRPSSYETSRTKSSHLVALTVTGNQGIARAADPHHQILWSFPSCDLAPWLPGSANSRRKVCSSWEEKEEPGLLLLTLNTMTVWSSSKSDHMPTLKTSGFLFDHWPDRSDGDCCPCHTHTNTHTAAPTFYQCWGRSVPPWSKREGRCTHLRSRRSQHSFLSYGVSHSWEVVVNDSLHLEETSKSR